MSQIGFIKNSYDGATRITRSEDPYEFQVLTNPEGDDDQMTLSTHFTDDPEEAYAWAGHLKFAEEVMFWDWIIHYSDGTKEYAFRSIWLENGVPESTVSN